MYHHQHQNSYLSHPSGAHKERKTGYQLRRVQLQHSVLIFEASHLDDDPMQKSSWCDSIGRVNKNYLEELSGFKTYTCDEIVGLKNHHISREDFLKSEYASLVNVIDSRCCIRCQVTLTGDNCCECPPTTLYDSIVPTVSPLFNTTVSAESEGNHHDQPVIISNGYGDTKGTAKYSSVLVALSSAFVFTLASYVIRSYRRLCSRKLPHRRHQTNQVLVDPLQFEHIEVHSKFQRSEETVELDPSMFDHVLP